MFAVVAVALGPLEADDLIDLVCDLGAIANAFSARNLLRPLRRFVIGDGSRESGFVLSHPKIGQYLQEEYLSRRVVDRTQKTFVTWGRRVIDKLNRSEYQAEQVPHYLLHFHTRHLASANAPDEDFLALVDTTAGARPGKPARGVHMASPATYAVLWKPHAENLRRRIWERNFVAH